MLIELTRVDKSKIYINFYQIEMVEKKVNTVVRMMNEVIYIVLETPEEINSKIKEKLKEFVNFLMEEKDGGKKI